MRIIFTCLLLLSLSFSGLSQDYVRVDSIIATYPKTFSNPEQLSDKIISDFEDPFERVRAAFDWLALNVYYDIEESGMFPFSYSSKEEQIRKEATFQKKLAKRVISKNRAVCEGYSNLFKELCDLMEIKCIIVSGDGKGSISDIKTRFNSSSHAWNMVTINGKNYLLDATWAADDSTSDIAKKEIRYQYFLTPPEDFIKDHYPADYKYSLLKEVVPKSAFVSAPIIYDITSEVFDLITPVKTGILKVGRPVDFKFRSSIPISWISYRVGKDHYEVKNFKRDGDRVSFSIELRGKIGRELVVYLNGKPTVGYKIQK